MEEDLLYIKLEQIPGGVRLSENYSQRFVECLQTDKVNESMSILQGLISVIGEVNRSYFYDVLYQIFGYSPKALKNYLLKIADNTTGDHLFERGHGHFYEEVMVEGSLPVQTEMAFSVSMDPVGDAHLELTIHDGVFKHTKKVGTDSSNPAVITAAAFADTLYGELYFPAIKLLTGDEAGETTKSFIRRTIDEQFVPMA